MKEAGLPVRRGNGWTVAAFTAVASAVCALLALASGQDVNYDQLNYHFYAPYALFNHRVLYDIFPAFVGPTFTNPIPYLPFYWLAWNAPPMLIGALLGALYGLSCAPLYLLARTVPPAPARRSQPAALVLAALGLTGAVAIAENGTTFIDNLMSALVLSGLAVAAVAMPRLARASPMRAIMWAATAGFPVGLAAGFKLTMAIYCVAFVLGALVVPRRWPERMAIAVAAGLAIGTGLLVAGGPWFAIMWAKTGNPIFPFLNQVFQSPLAMVESYRDDSGVPDSFWKALLFPFLVSDQVMDAGVSFFDLRVPTLYALAIVSLWLLPIRRRYLSLNPAGRFVLVFAAVAYILWLGLFAIWRYLLPIEMLAPVLITALVSVIVSAVGLRPAAMLASAVLLGVIALTTRPADWGHISWNRELYGVRVPPIRHPDQALVLMAGTAPTAFLIPFFPARIPFIRLEGFSEGMWDTSSGLFRIGEERVRAHQNDIYVLYGFDQEASARTVASHFSLVFDRGRCQTVENRVQPVDAPEGPVLLCLLRRAEGAT
ncbi:hypothetical protein [Bradyrhizobium sp.]|uniref:hypothetical protein n=1 Tax=Bradyrhizobium sp. TaxID=376 RepID=UPI001ED2A286|nr:hypothetical protein [Bradyrhizobium sp.]MBV9982563.1 hypothetical protein [Bradyrhizobium sp.]